MGGGGFPDTHQYVLTLEQFHVDLTLSGDGKDTDIVTFRAKVGDVLYPTQTRSLYSVQNGDHLIGLGIGPILAPTNTPVNFFYSIINSGYDASDANLFRKIMDGLSDIAALFCKLVLGKDAAWDKLNQYTKEINKLSFVNCDGPAAVGGELVAIDRLDLWTSNGLYRQPDHYPYDLPLAVPPCHKQSNYTVTWSVAPRTVVLDLLGVSSDGRIWHAFRRDDGIWQPLRPGVTLFNQVESSSSFVDASNAGSLNGQLHICGITATAEGSMLDTLNADLPQFVSFWDVKKSASDPGAFNRVGIATLFGELHVCGITPHDGNIWHTIRHVDANWQGFSWQAFGNVKSQTSNPGTFVDVSSAGVASAGELHVCAITADGGLWHTIRHTDGSWQAFSDVKSLAGNPGMFQRVGITSAFNGLHFNELHVCAITDDGGLWHTIRHTDGSWQAFSDVKSLAGNPGAFVDVSGAGIGYRLHLCGVTSDGSVWHTLRDFIGIWTPFDNVTGQAGNQSNFEGGQPNFLAVSATESFEMWAPPQPPPPPQVIINGPTDIKVQATDLPKSHPFVSAGYDLTVVSLQSPLKIQWMGGQGTTIINSTAISTAIDFEMTGQVGDGQDFQVSIQVTDRLGVSASDQKTVSIDIIGSKGG